MPASFEGERIRERFDKLQARQQTDWDLLRREMLEVSARNLLRRAGQPRVLPRTLAELKADAPRKVEPQQRKALAAE